MFCGIHQAWDLAVEFCKVIRDIGARAYEADLALR
jgi:hypothetical protein